MSELTEKHLATIAARCHAAEEDGEYDYGVEARIHVRLLLTMVGKLRAQNKEND